MFSQLYENLQRVTEANVQLQQEMIKKWMGLWPGSPASAPMWGEALPLPQLQKKWADTITGLLKRQRDIVETAIKLGQENIEMAFQLGEVKTFEEMRSKTIELWQKCLESLRETNEVQMREFQAATERWLELLGQPAG